MTGVDTIGAKASHEEHEVLADQAEQHFTLLLQSLLAHLAHRT